MDLGGLVQAVEYIKKPEWGPPVCTCAVHGLSEYMNRSGQKGYHPPALAGEKMKTMER